VVADAPHPKRLSRAESKARTRRQLLDAAAKVIARKGFAGASVEEIADTAGYTVGAFYSNFESKEQLLVELVVDQRARSIAALTAVFSGVDADLADQLVALSHRLGEIADQGAAFAAPGESGAGPLRSPAVRRAVAGQLRGQMEELEQLLAGVLERQGVAAGVSAATVTTVVLALIQGLVRRRRLEPSGVDDEVIDQALRWLFAGIRAESASSSPSTAEGR
jgi:AcrR family transcriptional regulator